MKCLRPINVNGDLLPCGKCEACLANKTNEYIIRFNATNRKMCAYFCTLTYEDRTIPKNGVFKGDCQCWINILRRYLDIKGVSFKYVLVSEYGGRRCRPHYHVNLFTDKPIDIFQTLEDTWKFGIVHAKFVTDKELNYIAKYHSTEILSKNIRKFRDYPIFFRVDDDKSLEECEKSFYERFGIAKDEWSKFPTIACSAPFRMTSRGIGEELLSEPSFMSEIRQGHFYALNNYKRKSSLPRYYVDKLSLSDQIRQKLAKFEYARTRESNKIDDLAVSINDYKSALDHYSKEWAKNYENNVLRRKKHDQANID